MIIGVVVGSIGWVVALGLRRAGKGDREKINLLASMSSGILAFSIVLLVLDRYF